MKRMLVIPAAGRGSRLGFDGPKALCPVNGRPMLDHLIERHAPFVSHVVVVTAPNALAGVTRHLAATVVPVSVVVQPEPTGMLPAILCGSRIVADHRPDEVWITWCDQIGISRQTVERLAAELSEHPTASLVFPTVRQEPPYIHFARSADGRIAEVRQRREGDPMPRVGESDAGLFGLRFDAFTDQLPRYDASAATGKSTSERNFLPFIPWLAHLADVRTFPLADVREATGVNTPEDLRTVEAYLRARA